MEKKLSLKRGNKLIKVKCWKCNKEALICEETGVQKGDEKELYTWIRMCDGKYGEWIYECPDCD